MASGSAPTPNWMVDPSSTKAAARAAMFWPTGSAAPAGRAMMIGSSTSTSRSISSTGISPAPKV